MFNGIGVWGVRSGGDERMSYRNLEIWQLARVLVVDPLSHDYLAMMRNLGVQISESFGDPAVSK